MRLISKLHTTREAPKAVAQPHIQARTSIALFAVSQVATEPPKPRPRSATETTKKAFCAKTCRDSVTVWRISNIIIAAVRVLTETRTPARDARIEPGYRQRALS